MTKTDEILIKLNYLNESNKGGFKNPTSLSSIVVDVNNLFINLANKGIVTPEQISSYEASLVSDTRVFDYDHSGLSVATQLLKDSLPKQNINVQTKVI